MNKRSLLVRKLQLREHDGSEIVIFQNLLEFAELNYGNFSPIIKGVEHISIVWAIPHTPSVDSPPSVHSKKAKKK